MSLELKKSFIYLQISNYDIFKHNRFCKILKNKFCISEFWNQLLAVWPDWAISWQQIFLTKATQLFGGFLGNQHF